MQTKIHTMICTYEYIQIIVDDECYMGKDGQLTECADFGKNNKYR